MRRNKWLVTGVAAGAVALGAGAAAPAQAATGNYTRLDCGDTAATSSLRAAMDVYMSTVSGSYWKITGMKDNTASDSKATAAFKAESLQLQLQQDGSGSFRTLRTWGDGSTNSVAASGTSDASTWGVQPNVRYQYDNLRLKLSQGGRSFSCTIRPVGWIPG